MTAALNLFRQILLLLQVNEEGCEAAAATTVGIMVMCLPPPPPQFNADHPFMFAVVKKTSILFIGQYV